jgi:predicted PurR-regulated permease PerM
MNDAAPADRTAARHRMAAVAALGVLLLLALHLQLIAPLFAALASYALYSGLQGVLRRHMGVLGARIASLALTILAVAAVALLLFEAVEFLWAPNQGLARLLQLLADTLDRLRTVLPDWMVQNLPETAEELRAALSEWLRSHSSQLQHWGNEALRLIAYLVVGTVIGLMVAFSRHTEPRSHWQQLARERLAHLSGAFADVVAAQVRISFVNTLLTAAYLLAALPLAGYHVPLAKTLVLVTFFVSLIPIVGNLLSNTAIVLAALTVSGGLGIASLVFLVVIHKLEYFLNAHLVGHRIDVPAYALLASMLALEAAFGVAGLVAAPIYCAWLARELREAGVV